MKIVILRAENKNNAFRLSGEAFVLNFVKIYTAKKRTKFVVITNITRMGVREISASYGIENIDRHAWDINPTIEIVMTSFRNTQKAQTCHFSFEVNFK